MNKLRRLGAFAVSPLWSLDISWCVLYDCVKYFHYIRRVTSNQFVMSKVSVCLSLFRFPVVIVTALACTETRITFFFKQVKKTKRQEKSFKRTPAVGVMQMQKLRSLC